MIVEMKKTTVLCLDSCKIETLEALRELGVLHVDFVRRSESEDVEALAKELSNIDRVANILSGLKPSGIAAVASPLDAFLKASEKIDAETAVAKRLDALQRERERIEPWGDFDPKTIEKLKAEGVYAYLCVGSKADLAALPEGASANVICDRKGTLHYLVVSRTQLDPLAIRAIQIPQARLSSVDAEISKAAAELSAVKADLKALAGRLKEIAERREEVDEKLEFLLHRDSMATSGRIAYIQGYVPAPLADKLSALAKEKGWGLVLETPKAEDAPPTLLKNPKWMKIISPLFEMIGIAPGYREFDVTAFFLVFFTIFFGMIVADAGYALGFLGIAILARFAIKSPAAKTPLNLFMLLSCSALAWGLITGTFFGLPAAWLKAHGLWFLAGLPMFSDPEHSAFAMSVANRFHIEPGELSDKFVQWFCFFLAALHLSGARLFRTISEIRHNWHAISDLGWGFMIWGNFFTAVNLIVFNGSFPAWGIWVYVAGVVLILAGLNWKEASVAMNLPFAMIGSFVDVLSYIRLFAVGMSGFYIAKCFNNMGVMAYDSLASMLVIGGVLFAIVVILFGHVLNIALAFLGVLVHAIRLNALEFSNHMELQWTGVKYRPFSKDNSTNQG